MVLLNVGDVSSFARSFVRHLSHHNCDNLFIYLFIFSFYKTVYVVFMTIVLESWDEVFLFAYIGVM